MTLLILIIAGGLMFGSLKPIRVLVVGYGNMGASHATAYHSLDGFNICGIVSTGNSKQVMNNNHAALDAHGKFVKEDTWITMNGEPDHQSLCNREQLYFQQAIWENIDLADHIEDAVNSLRIAFACDESVRTGKVVSLASEALSNII